ncbi:hypothetical protein LA080_004172 [Diaporthe eres]|nr:hypothetical protein LA080_004172 [Diaporthe eres]
MKQSRPAQRSPPHIADFSLGEDIDLVIGLTAAALAGNEVVNIKTTMHTVTVTAGSMHGTITRGEHLRKTSATNTSITALLHITTKLDILTTRSATLITAGTISRITHITTVAIA